MPATECAALAEISETLKIYDCYAAGRGQARSYHRPLFAARQRVGVSANARESFATEAALLSTK